MSQDAHENWVARWVDHAEVYAMLAEHALPLPFLGGYFPGGPDGPGILDGLRC